MVFETENKLNNTQILLLQLFERDLPEDDLKEVKNLLTRFLFKKAEQEAQKSMKKNRVSLKQLNTEIEDLNNGSRTELIKKIKSK